MATLQTSPRAVTAFVRPLARSPWRAVLPFAVLLAAADGFWVTALRGAVGSIMRTGHPMRGWLVQSALVLPVYVVALLLAAGFARRRRWSGLRAGVALAGFGTLAGTIHLLGDTVYNYRLESSHLADMGSMGGLCLQSCLHHEWVLTWHLQVRAAALGIGILAVTNLVVVLWLLALRGGRLDLRTSAAHEARPRPVTLVLVASLLGAAVIHAAVIPEHLAEWWAAALFFVLLTVAELLTAAVVLLRPRIGLIATVVVSAGPLVVWAWSRATGLPFGPEAWEREAVGLPDVLSCLLELGALVLAARMLASSARASATLTHARMRIVAVALLAVTLVAAGNGLGLFGTGMHHGEEESPEVPAATAT